MLHGRSMGEERGSKEELFEERLNMAGSIRSDLPYCWNISAPQTANSVLAPFSFLFDILNSIMREFWKHEAHLDQNWPEPRPLCCLATRDGMHPQLGGRSLVCVACKVLILFPFPRQGSSKAVATTLHLCRFALRSYQFLPQIPFT